MRRGFGSGSNPSDDPNVDQFESNYLELSKRQRLTSVIDATRRKKIVAAKKRRTREDASDRERLDKLVQRKRKDIVDVFGEEKAESEDNKKRKLDTQLGLSDSEDDFDTDELHSSSSPHDSLVAQSEVSHEERLKKMFKRQGLDANTRLGKNSTGIREPIQLSSQKGRAGLGSKANEFSQHGFNAEWDSSLEKKTVEEYVSWLTASDEIRSRIEDFLKDDAWENWMVIDERKERIDDETSFCEPDLLKRMLDAKSVFDELSDRELMQSRARANPYETIKCGFFQNRAAMKAANMDAVFDWIFTNEDKKNLLIKNPLDLNPDGTVKEGINTDRDKPLFYFADVCAGPGGFSEYILWRKGFYNAKGFGFTLKGKDDFKLDRFTAASPNYFEPFYGKYNDGDVTRPENIESFEKFIKDATEEGVHLMMADGGFSVEGRENIQEILSKRLYLCQFLVALSIVRDGGVFFCKLFDIFTPFSIGLIYLMYIAFDRISLHKPNTSRPANSERYIICQGLRESEAEPIKNYLIRINNKLDSLEKAKSHKDVVRIVPSEIIDDDPGFLNYIKEHNDSFLEKQILYLEKYKVFAKDQGKIDLDQGKLRDECMDYWSLPKVERKGRNRNDKRNVSMMDSFTKLCQGELIELDKLRKARPPFLLKHVTDAFEKGMKYEEFRLCALSGRNEQSPPIILFSNERDVFIQSNSSYDGFEKLHNPPRIPKNSLLLVQKTERFEKLDERSNISSRKFMYRILDAAVIDDDNVSRLPFEERMNAARKMCYAVKLNAPNVEACPLVTAEVFKLEELNERRSSFGKVCYRGEESVFFKENDYFCYCRGMWVISLLKDLWRLVWSKTQKKCYLFNRRKNENHLCDETESGSLSLKIGLALDCFTSFWSTTALPKDPEKASVRQWDWSHNFVEGKNYGPTAILELEEHPSGKPTLQSLHKAANYQMVRCGIPFGTEISWTTQG